MASLNKVLLIGNLTKDPELRKTPGGMAVSDLRLATSRKFKTASGENREETCFLNVTVWGRQAETCAEYLSKGSPILVEGRLKYDEWEREGQKHSRVSVVAERVQFLGSPRGRSTPVVEDVPADMESGPGPQAARDEPPVPAGPSAAPAGGGGDDDDLPF